MYSQSCNFAEKKMVLKVTTEEKVTISFIGALLSLY